MPDLKIHHLQKNKYSMFKSLHLSRDFYSLYFNFSNFASRVRRMKKNNLLSQSVSIMASHLSYVEAMKVFRCQKNEKKSVKMFWQNFPTCSIMIALKKKKKKYFFALVLHFTVGLFPGKSSGIIHCCCNT